MGPNAGTGELTQVTTPYGGHLRWTYQANTYVGSRAFREVQYRYLSQSSGAAETAVSLNHDPGDTNRNVHYYTYLVDVPSNAGKMWYFQTDTSQFNAGLAFLYQETTYDIGASLVRQDFTWAQTPTSANPYIGTIVATLNTSTSYQISKMTTQTLDRYGNLTDMQVYDFGNFSTPARTYHNTYLTSSNYTSRYMFNRLRASTVTDGTRTATLSQIYYDGEPGSCGGSSMIDPSLPPGLPPGPPITMHDAAYGVNFAFRGIPTGIITPASTVCNNFDVGGNITSSSTNGVTTSSTTTSSSDYAAPVTMTTGSLTNTMGYNGVLAPTSATGPNGESAAIGYDANARPYSTDSPSGAHTAITYNDTQSPPVVSAVVSSSNTSPHWSRKTMDGFGRTIKLETGSGSTPGTAIVSVVDTVYAPCGCSPLGKLWKTSMPHAPNATQYWTVYTYDGAGRTLSVAAPDGNGGTIIGSTTTYLYRGNTVKVTDPPLPNMPANSKTFTMDAMGNLTTVSETDPTLGPVTTAYTYDMLNHLTQVSMTRNGTQQNRYFNYTSGATVGAHLLSATNPETGQVTYTYNADHTLNTKTDAKGQVFTYAYDGYKRPLTVSVGGNVLRTYSYDTNPYDANYSQYSAGRLTAIQYAPITYEVYYGSPQGSTTFTDMFTYAQPGQVGGKRLRVTKVQPYLNGQNHTQTAVGDLNLGYGYNKEGKLSLATYPTDAYGHMPYFNYSFDPMMRPAGMTDQSGASVVSGVLYGPANELTQMSYNGGTETRSYNSMLQLTSISGLGQSVTYTFPPAGSNAGKIVSQTDQISGETVAYVYDSLNRLTSAGATSNAWSQTYSYDGFGNLTNRTGYGTAQSTTISTPANAATNQLSGYSYDLNGNQISTGYAYDAENRLVQANAGAVKYAYDGQNKRIWQATFSNCGGDSCLSSELISIFGIDGKLAGIFTAGAAWNNTQTQIQLSFYSSTQRVYFGKKLVATLDWQGNQNGVVQDRLESVGKYYPFGEERNSPPLANDQVKFATYTRDSATGLDYADQRYYSSTFGRFMTTDPTRASISINRPSSFNRYTYVEGDPANSNDPTGLYVPDPLWCSMYPFDPECTDPCSPVVIGAQAAEWCPAPEPQPAPPARPKLDCTYKYKMFDPVFSATSLNLPILFYFAATGGTGTYTWDNIQLVSNEGTLQYQTYTDTYYPLAHVDGTGPMPNLTPGTPVATLSDRPGIGTVDLISANMRWDFKLAVSVSDGVETVQCPIVWWGATLVWPKTGPPNFTGWVGLP